MYSYRPPHMAKQKQDDQLEHTYSSYVMIQDVDLNTCQRRWTIGRSGKRGPGISVLAARHDDDDVAFNIYFVYISSDLTAFIIGPTNRRNTAQGLFMVGPDAGPHPTRTQHFLSMPRRHIAPRFWPSKPLAGLGRIWNRYLLTMLTWNRTDSTPLSAAPRAPNNYGRQ